MFQIVSPYFCLTPIEYNVLREVFSESSSNSDNDEDEDEDDEEEEDDYDDVDDEEEEEEDYFEEDPERELQAKFIESGQYEAKEGTSSVGELEEKNKGMGHSGWQC